MLVEAWLEEGEIKEAKIIDTLYRGFEQILEGRPAMDMPYYTQRICGVCSSGHGIASALAVEQAFGMHIPSNAQILRNLILAGDFIQNHLRHFYLMCLPDYFRGPDIPPFTPHLEGDIRLSKNEDELLTNHYFQALEICRDAHAAFAVFGGKAPHGHGIVPGGCTIDIDTDKINRYRGYMIRILEFIDSIMVSDIELLMKHYPEYIELGKGNGNYLSVGAFPNPDGSTLVPHGVYLQGKAQDLDPQQITEEVGTAWYKPTSPHPLEARTEPDRSQTKGYTWIKAPRYQGQPVEVGSLARAVIAKENVVGHGALGRLWARVQETKKIAEVTLFWLNSLKPGAETLDTRMTQDSGEGIGFFEAMRGSLGHWIRIEKGRVKNYQIITPSTFNFSSRDEAGTRSVGESAIIGLKVQNPDLKEAGRIIRSLDPCFSCSVHLLNGEKLSTLHVHV